MTTQLIPVFSGEVSGVPVNLVDARLLHSFLEVARDFSTWIKKRIEEYDFLLNIDYLEYSPKLGNKGKPRIDYHLTIDMAKELGMIERSEKGRQIRRYFLEMERIAHQSQYGTNQLPEPKTKKALPGGLTPEQQDAIKALVKERAQSLPKNKQAGATVRMWSAIKKKFGASYKAVPPNNFVNIISLVSRMPLEGEFVERDDRLLSDNDYRAKARSIAIGYINACRESVKAAAGIQPKWPEIPQELADGILADMLMSQRFMLSFDNDMKLKMSQIPKNAYVIDPDNKPSMAELMLEHINGDLLPELMQIALTRLANAAKQN
jgi:phage anti-repressor protein